MSEHTQERLITLFLTGIAVLLLFTLFSWSIISVIKSYQQLQYDQEYHEARMEMLNAELKASEAEKEVQQKLLRDLKELE